MEKGKPTAESGLIAAAELKPWQQQHGTAGQRRQGQRRRHRNGFRIGKAVQSPQGLRFHLEQGHGRRTATFGEQTSPIPQGETPGLMDAATGHGLHIKQLHARQWPL